MNPKPILCQVVTISALCVTAQSHCNANPTSNGAKVQTAQATASKAAPQANRPASGQFVNWYPSSIALPQGLNYPCALTPLPAALPGIPAGDRNYINHVYSMLLKCVQAKTIMLSKLKRGEAAALTYDTTRTPTKHLRPSAMSLRQRDWRASAIRC
ncbi:MAG: hypothetical protein IPP57_12270 [Candidatus Obscuribacter sp.]|nr:hypothetical protein [Candidatus Obscuribacter sp.]